MIEIIFFVLWYAWHKGSEDGKWGCMIAILVFVALIPLLGSCSR